MWPALMLGDQRIEHGFPPGLESGQCAGLILFHQPTVADHIGSEDGCEATFHCILPWQTTLGSANPKLETTQ